MTSADPPNPWFSTINFNESFFPANTQTITLSYANTNFLKRVGIATSVASLTTFNGSVGVNGTLTSATLAGSKADFSGEVNFNSLVSPPHCAMLPSSADDLCNKQYVDSQAPLTSYQLFLNYTETFTTPVPASITYSKLNKIEILTPTPVPFTISTIGTQLIAGFFNSLVGLNIPSSIPAGLWTILCYSNVNLIADQSHIGIFFTIIGYSSAGVETILYTSVSSPLITVVSPLIGTSSVSLTVPLTSLSGYTGIGIKLYISSNVNAIRTGTIFFQNQSSYSSLLTSFRVQQAPDLLSLNNIWTGTNDFTLATTTKTIDCVNGPLGAVPSLKIRDSNTTNEIDFITTATAGAFNLGVIAGDSVIHTQTTPANLSVLNLTTQNTVSSGLRIAPTSVVLGMGATAAAGVPSSNISFTNANTMTLSTSSTPAISIAASGLTNFRDNILMTSATPVIYTNNATANLTLQGTAALATYGIVMSVNNGASGSCLDIIPTGATTAIITARKPVSMLSTLNINGTTTCAGITCGVITASQNIITNGEYQLSSAGGSAIRQTANPSANFFIQSGPSTTFGTDFYINAAAIKWMSAIPTSASTANVTIYHPVSMTSTLDTAGTINGLVVSNTAITSTGALTIKSGIGQGIAFQSNNGAITNMSINSSGAIQMNSNILMAGVSSNITSTDITTPLTIGTASTQALILKTNNGITAMTIDAGQIATFNNTPLAPTAIASDTSTKVATTAFVKTIANPANFSGLGNSFFNSFLYSTTNPNLDYMIAGTLGGLAPITNAAIVTPSLTTYILMGIRLQAGLIFNRYGWNQQIGAGATMRCALYTSKFVYVPNTISTAFSAAPTNNGGKIEVATTADITIPATDTYYIYMDGAAASVANSVYGAIVANVNVCNYLDVAVNTFTALSTTIPFKVATGVRVSGSAPTTNTDLKIGALANMTYQLYLYGIFLSYTAP